MNRIVQWDKKYSIGVDWLDAEHRRVLEILHDLQHAVEQEVDETILLQLLDELDALVRHHFKIEHNRFEQETSDKSLADYDLKTQTRDAAGREVTTAEIVKFLCGWWPAHIIEHKKMINEPLTRRRTG